MRVNELLFLDSSPEPFACRHICGEIPRVEMNDQVAGSSDDRVRNQTQHVMKGRRSEQGGGHCECEEEHDGL
jgi:hypothetical protein